MDEESTISSKELFEPAGTSRGAAITLPKKTKGGTAKASQFLLPEDRHFTSKQLLRLFKKPRMAVSHPLISRA